MKLCGCQNEEKMLRRLLDDFQQSIKGTHRKHVNLVNDIHTLLHLCREVNGIIPKGTDIVDTVIGGGVDLQHVNTSPCIDTPACRAAVAGIAVHGRQAVHRLRQDLGTGSLAGTAGTCEQIGMAHSAIHKLILQGLCNAKLSHHIIKGLRTVFPI